MGTTRRTLDQSTNTSARSTLRTQLSSMARERLSTPMVTSLKAHMFRESAMALVKRQWTKMVMDEDEGVEKQALDEEGNKVFASFYEGSYKDNMKDGEGRMEFPDGGVYEGSWNFDKRYGDGAYWYPNGDIYSGEWKFGCKHGRGTFINKATSAKLVGTFADGEFVKGKWVMVDSTYTGAFKDNKPNGPGSFLFKHSGNRQE